MAAEFRFISVRCDRMLDLIIVEGDSTNIAFDSKRDPERGWLTQIEDNLVDAGFMKKGPAVLSDEKKEPFVKEFGQKLAFYQIEYWENAESNTVLGVWFQ